MVFHSGKKKVMYPKLLMNNIEIERVDSFIFLGLQLNHNLIGISLKVSKISGIIYRLRSQFPSYILNSINVKPKILTNILKLNKVIRDVFF